MLLQAVVRWSAHAGAPLSDAWAADAGQGITPLHLAAALDDGGRLADRILRVRAERMMP